jgi:hypothetical protein
MKGEVMFDKVWKVGLLLVFAAGVGGSLMQARYMLVPLPHSLLVEYDHFTGRTRVGEVEMERIGMTDRDSGRVVWLPQPLK